MPSPDRLSPAEAAKALRELLTPKPRLTQQGLAKLMRAAARKRGIRVRGPSQVAISTWARGSFRPSLAMRLLLEDVVGIPADSWLTPSERKEQERAPRQRKTRAA